MRSLALRRIGGLLYRHIAIYRQSRVQLIELFYVPMVQMLVWGFTASYLTSQFRSTDGLPNTLGTALVTGFLLWEVTLRSQLGVAGAFLEELWSRNLVNLLVSPLRPAEFMIGLAGISVIRTAVGFVPAALLAEVLYGYNVLRVGPVLILLILNLVMMGWWLALAVVILILRHGAGAQGFAWSITISLTPLAAIFYPVDVLPHVLRTAASFLPASHVFEALRAITEQRGTPWSEIADAFLLNLVLIVGIGGFLVRQFARSRVNGSLVNAAD